VTFRVFGAGAGDAGRDGCSSTVHTATCVSVSAGGDGVVHTWDLRTQRCVARQVDEGCLKGTSLAAAGDGTRFATGSNSGVVNLYHRAERASAAQQAGRAAAPVAAAFEPPAKSFMNLTTTIDSLAFRWGANIGRSETNRTRLVLLRLQNRTFGP
jgi:WD40 repeat protein